MSDLVFDNMLQRMVAAAHSHGPTGIAFCMPIEPDHIAPDLTATLYMFHGEAGEMTGDSRVLAVYAGLNAEQSARRAGQKPRRRASVW